MQGIVKEVFTAILDGDLPSVEQNVRKALAAGLEPEFILKEGLVSAMTEIGHRFEANEAFIPEMLVAARAMKGGLGVLRPLLLASNVEPAGKVVIGTIQGDLHDIGKDLVAMMLEGVGFEVDDLGVDVPPEKFLEAIEAKRPGIVAMSALLSTTMINLPEVIKGIAEAGLRGKVRIMVGGAPLTQEYANEIGADGYAPDASRAARLALDLLAQAGGAG